MKGVVDLFKILDVVLQDVRKNHKKKVTIFRQEQGGENFELINSTRHSILQYRDRYIRYRKLKNTLKNNPNNLFEIANDLLESILATVNELYLRHGLDLYKLQQYRLFCGKLNKVNKKYNTLFKIPLYRKKYRTRYNFFIQQLVSYENGLLNDYPEMDQILITVLGDNAKARMS